MTQFDTPAVLCQKQTNYKTEDKGIIILFCCITYGILPFVHWSILSIKFDPINWGSRKSSEYMNQIKKKIGNAKPNKMV